MEKLSETIESNLNIIFNVLREKEGIKKGALSEAMGATLEYSILLNRRYKLEHGIELTRLEEMVAKQEGNFVRMFVLKQYNDLHIGDLKTLPFPNCDVEITYEELNAVLNGSLKNKNLVMQRDKKIC